MSDDLRVIASAHGDFCWRELGHGPPLVLLHGWSGSHAFFAEIAEDLAADFRVLIPDLPGHGASVLVEPCTLEAIADLLTKWLTDINVDQADFLGWSLGGQIAMRLAITQPQVIQRLVLVASTPRFCASDDWSAGLPVSELRALRRGLLRRYQATMGDFFDLQFKGEQLPPERRREILQFAVRPVGLPDPEDAISTLDILAQADLRSFLPEIDFPTLVLHGDIDQIVPFAAGCYLAENIQGAQLKTLNAVGHAPFLSRPEQFIPLLRDFLHDTE